MSELLEGTEVQFTYFPKCVSLVGLNWILCEKIDYLVVQHEVT